MGQERPILELLLILQESKERDQGALLWILGRAMVPRVVVKLLVFPVDVAWMR